VNAAPPTLLVCTPSHYLHGGVERIIEALGAGLPQYGFRLVVGLARGERFHDPARFRKEYPALECVEIDGRSGTRLGRVRGVRRVLEKLRPDIVLIARMFDAYDAVVECKAAGMPLRLAVTVDAYEPEYIHDLSVHGDWVDLCRTCGRLLAQAVEHFTPLPPERIVSIPGGIRPATRFVEYCDDKPLRLGYVGRLAQTQKRIFDLVDTLAGLTAARVPFTCQIAGSGPEEEELRRRLREQGLEAQIVYHGWKTVEQLYQEVYPQLDVLLHFSAWEGVTIAPREAMVHGVVPVVSRFTGCLSEGLFVHEHNALTFAVGNVGEAIAAVQSLHQDRSLLRRLAAAAMKTEEDNGSESGALRSWAEAFQRMMAQPVRRGSSRPHISRPPNGRLERWGFPPTWSETLRGFLGRKSLHTQPGSEWPHCSGSMSEMQSLEITFFAERQEKELERERFAVL
jgi:glycosyltransferase involved in cell wall biosynthesis